MKKADLIQMIQWIGATVVVAVGTVFTVMHFAYSDFDTQRTNDVYRDQIEKRLDVLQSDFNRMDGKIDLLIQKADK